MRESEMAKPVADWMRGQGYEIYAEIPFVVNEERGA